MKNIRQYLQYSSYTSSYQTKLCHPTLNLCQNYYEWSAISVVNNKIHLIVVEPDLLVHWTILHPILRPDYFICKCSTEFWQVFLHKLWYGQGGALYYADKDSTPTPEVTRQRVRQQILVFEFLASTCMQPLSYYLDIHRYNLAMIQRITMSLFCSSVVVSNY